MILRRFDRSAVGHPLPESDKGADPDAGTPIRWRLSLITALIVAAAVGAMTLVTYWTITGALTSAVDAELDAKATGVASRSEDLASLAGIREDIEQFKLFNPDTRISVQPRGESFTYGDSIQFDTPVVQAGMPVARSARTIGNERVLAKRYSDGTTVVLAQNMGATHDLITALGSVLLVICLLGILLSIVAGALVSTTGLRPLVRFQRAVDRITQTDELRPIPVVGNDEVAQLTVSFNEMVEALQESRVRQIRLIADAGHELKTPLTSIRTNIELLLMVSRSGLTMPEQERMDIKSDVIAQLDEMSTLVNDLVDLARNDGDDPAATGEIDFDDVIDAALERVKRRHSDLIFEVDSQPWLMVGDGAALERAVVNLVGNAGKWSPPGGTVRVQFRAISEEWGKLEVSDSGTGIPDAERKKVFQRFYRVAESRSMPGSGLGLSIVQQAIERHGGSVWVESSEDGGAKLVATVPRRPQES